MALSAPMTTPKPRGGGTGRRGSMGGRVLPSVWRLHAVDGALLAVGDDLEKGARVVRHGLKPRKIKSGA
jgi:hypothetical protein